MFQEWWPLLKAIKEIVHLKFLILSFTHTQLVSNLYEFQKKEIHTGLKQLEDE